MVFSQVQTVSGRSKVWGSEGRGEREEDGDGKEKKKKAKDLKIKENVYLVVDVELRFRNLEKIS